MKLLNICLISLLLLSLLGLCITHKHPHHKNSLTNQKIKELRTVLKFFKQIYKEIKRNSSHIISKDYDLNIESRLLLSGFLDQTMQGDWNKTFLNLVDYSFFPYDLIIESFESLIGIDFTNSSPSNFYKIFNATKKIASALDLLLNNTFNNSLRLTKDYERIYRQLIKSRKNYNFYAFANATKYLASSYQDNLSSLFLEIKWVHAKDMHRAGMLWGFLDVNLTNVDLFNSYINFFIANISVETSTPAPGNRNTTEDRYSRELLQGFLETTSNQTVPSEFLNMVNSSIFNYKQIVNGFKDLAFNGYNFSRNHTDEERYTESVGVLSLNLRNVLMLSFESRQKEELVQELNKSFVLFNEHSELLEKIRRLFEKNIDIRYYFQTAYEKAQYHSEFFLAGRIWGESVKVLIVGSNNSNSSQNDQNAREFFYGLMNNSINHTWNSTILARINSKNFDVRGILSELEFIEKNMTNASSFRRNLFNIADRINFLINELFPLVGYGYRYGIVLRAIPSEYQEVFEVLNRTFALYQNFKGFQIFLEDKNNVEIVRDELKWVRKTENFFQKGKIWQKLNEFIERITEEIMLIEVKVKVETKKVDRYLRV